MMEEWKNGMMEEWGIRRDRSCFEDAITHGVLKSWMRG
jgi:hypothetical protein